MRKVFILLLGVGILLALGIRFAAHTGENSSTPKEVSEGANHRYSCFFPNMEDAA